MSRRPPSARRLLPVACAVAVYACSDDATAPAPDLATAEVDPAPAAAGIFLGSAVSGGAGGGCFDVAAAADTDRDGVTDRCETTLAQAFAPELAYNAGDKVGREERWAGRPLALADGSRGVRLAYLLSYYLDLGPVGCRYGIILCGGHYGDSEAIWLDLYYDGRTSHWVLDRAEYSAHDQPNVYVRATGAYPSLTYPAKVGGYPRSYVSRQKHANYRSDAACDLGNYGLDDCQANARARVRAGGGFNVGSSLVRLQDCVTSTQYPGPVECYWTDRPFGGWQGRTPAAAAYATKLASHGF